MCNLELGSVNTLTRTKDILWKTMTCHSGKVSLEKPFKSDISKSYKVTTPVDTPTFLSSLDQVY